MRTVSVAFFCLAACAIAAASPDGTPPSSDRILELASNVAAAPPLFRDDDGDGYFNIMDCNDDDSAVHPFATERSNAVDDDCDGVVDDGLDTTADRPRAKDARMLWPDHKARRPDEWVPLPSAPRIIWTGERFLSVWVDRGGRIRFAGVDQGGTLLDDPPLVLREGANAVDVAWTGSRLGIVYEDLSVVPTAARLMTVDASGSLLGDVLVAPGARGPRIAWGQDRFGIVWRVAACAGDCLVFQRFDRYGTPLGPGESLENSGYAPAIAFSGTAIELDATRFDRHEGAFGIAYEAYYGFAASSDVLLTVRPRDSYAPAATVRVNEHDHPVSRLGALPSVAANVGGFAVCWHEFVDGKDAARARTFGLDPLRAVQELAVDDHAGRASRMVWTGGEYVMVNDNVVAGTPEGLEVHLRRLDASGGSHLCACWGPWNEVVLSDFTPGNVSANPDVAGTGTTFGVVWIEQEEGLDRLGRIWFANVEHR